MQMKSRRYLSHAALSLAVVMACGAVGTAKATATATGDLAVSATVTAHCTIDASAGLSFDEYDPIVANATAALEKQGTINTTCTDGSDAVITLGQGGHADTGSSADAPLRRMQSGTTDFLSYQLYQDAATTVWGDTPATGATTTGTGAPVPVTVYGVVAPGQNVQEGSYTDTVTATVTF